MDRIESFTIMPQDETTSANEAGERLANYQPGPSEYLAMGFKAIRLRGYNTKSNPQHDYKKAKQALDKGYTNTDFNGLSLIEIEQVEKMGFSAGW